MTFLDPATGLTALAAGTLATLLWYFLKLRRRPLRVSSTMLWEAAARDVEVNAPFRWIRPSWLLLLQLLAVALLSGAAGRPAMTGAEASPGRWAILVDRSASMRARDMEGARTRLEVAIDRAEELIGRLGSDERAMLASFSTGARLEAAMTSDRGVLLSALGGIEATDQPADLGGALELAAAQLGEDASGVRVVILSDGGFESPEGGAPLGEAEIRFVRVGPSAGTPSTNTGIVAASARRDPEDPNALRAFARLTHAGAEAREATVSAFFAPRGGAERLAGAKTVRIEPGGEGSAVFETRVREGGVLRLEIAGGDALASDDEAFVTIPPARGAAALVVTPEGSEADPFVLRAVEVATRRPAAVIDLPAWESGASPAAALVVFDRASAEREPRESSLHLGAGAPFAGVRLVEFESGGARVLAWERRHPVMRYLSLDAVRLESAVALAWPEGSPATSIAAGESGSLVASIERGGSRRIVSAMAPSNSNWETDPSFALFVALATEWIAPATTGEGESVRTSAGVTVRAAAGSDRVAAEGPATVRAPVRADGLARLSAFPLVGVYELRGAEGGVGPLSVNLFDEGESSIETRDELVIAGRAVGAGGVDAIAVRELWRWFVLGGLALACIEWFIYAKKMRV